MLPSRPLDLVSPEPIVERFEYPTVAGVVVGDVYRPAGPGRHPGVVVCLGVVPFGVDHPQVPRLGAALARSGFAALLYWSPAMRDFRLDPEDIENIALAFECLLDQPYVDGHRSGLIGTCVGGSFALMASAHHLVRDRVRFICAFAPYGSLFSLARDIASSMRGPNEQRRPWQVDPLTRKVFVHSVTSTLSPREAKLLRDEFGAEGGARSSEIDSIEGRKIRALLAAVDPAQAEVALMQLPSDVQNGLRQLSPVTYAEDIHASLIAISHDRDDTVIPVGESRLLVEALHGRAGVRYTEFEMFEHADPTKRKLSPVRLARQLAKFYGWLHAVFRTAFD